MAQLALPNLLFSFNIKTGANCEVDILKLSKSYDIVFVVSCGSSKTSAPAPARSLYRSGLFSLSRDVAELFGAEQLVFSAKHGLIDFHKVIAPYDITLNSLPTAGYTKLVKSIHTQLKVVCHKLKNPLVIFLGGQAYSKIICSACNNIGVPIATPLSGLGLFERTKFLKTILNEYAWLQGQKAIEHHLAHSAHTLRLSSFNEFPNCTNVPQNGVYFFLDPLQTPKFSTLPGAVVRVGTHAVSKGSKATLRQRLRAHFGTNNGAGNHRASVFRLHVGASIIRSQGLEENYPLWGNPKISPKDAPTNELWLETQVSQYIRSLSLYAIPFDGDAHANNKRSQLERLCISAFSQKQHIVSQRQGTWLGAQNPHPVIRESGLWNINHTQELFQTTDFTLLKRLFKK